MTQEEQISMLATRLQIVENKLNDLKGHIQRNEVVNRQCADLQCRLSADGLRCCMLKGQGAGALYKFNNTLSYDDNSSINHKPLTINLQNLRQSGDIDVWVDAAREDIIEQVQKIAPTTNVREHHLELQMFL